MLKSVHKIVYSVNEFENNCIELSQKQVWDLYA